MTKKQVILGKTTSGRCGFFTYGWMVWSLTDEIYKELECNKEEARRYAKRLGYTLVSSKTF
jgi:hypothetical protein